MTNPNELRIANLEQAISYGDLTVSLFQQVQQAAFALRIPLFISALAAYALHLLFLQAAKNTPIPSPIGCLKIVSKANVRSHPSSYGKVLGGSIPNANVYYNYYAFQGDTDSIVTCDSNDENCQITDKWYQVAPFGYGKDGNEMWIRESSGTVARLTDISINCPSNNMVSPQLDSSVSNDTLPNGFSIETENFGGFTNDDDILVFILAAESAYDLQAARDIAYVFRARMMSDKFPNELFDVMKKYGVIANNKFYDWSSWGNSTLVNDFNNNLTSAQQAVVTQIRTEIIPSLKRLPPGGVGSLDFPASNPAIAHAMFTAGDILYQNQNEINDYFNSGNPQKLSPEEIIRRFRLSSLFPNALAFEPLRAIYIDHTLSSNLAGFTTVFFSDYYNA